MTDASDDEKIAMLLEQHGPEGYGVWWLILEAVALKTTKDNRSCEVSFPMSRWLKISGLYHHKKAREIIQSLHNLSLIYATSMNNLCNIYELSMKDALTISIPNLLKICDEYSRKSGQKPDSVL
jgi:hypothetical protein